MSELREAVVGRLATRLQFSPVRDPSARRELARTIVEDVLSDSALQRVRSGEPAWTVDDEIALGDAVLAAIFGLGRLQPLVDDPGIENIEANGCDDVWLCYADGREERGPAIAASDDELIELIQNLGARIGASERTFTTASPSLHLRLDDGSRLAAMAWTTPRPQLVIRRHRVRDVDLGDLVALGTIDRRLEGFLRAALRSGKNMVVTGLQNVGKTTLLRAIAGEFPRTERFATIEREYELHLHDLPDRHPRVVAMEAREGSAERDGSGVHCGEVSLSDLVLDALRMNLRRIIVGEVRGPEVLPMLDAMSTGDGSLCTLHARSARHAFDRLVTLCLSAGVGMTDTFAYRLAAGAVDLVVHLTLVDSGAGGRERYVSEVVEICGIGEFGRPMMTSVFGPGSDGRAVPQHRPQCLPDLVRAGLDPALLEPVGAGLGRVGR
ncbi:MAG TPA: CpaF/VirB11 family protein [Candidatus Nanopelagicales bacterium]|nr:CpaF/VirB11 family protein [Candidatus Nanopelagicales bacterium]